MTEKWKWECNINNLNSSLDQALDMTKYINWCFHCSAVSYILKLFGFFSWSQHFQEVGVNPIDVKLSK